MKKSINDDESQSGEEFDLLKSISDRLSVLEHNFYKITKQHRHIQKQSQSKSFNSFEPQLMKDKLLYEMKKEVQLMVANEWNRNRGRDKSGREEEDTFGDVNVKKMEDDIILLKQDATETYKIATKALKLADNSNGGRVMETIEQHCDRLLQASMNEVMKIIEKYIEDQSTIKLDIENLKETVLNEGFGINRSNSPKSNKVKRTASASKTTDKKSNLKFDSKWDGGASEKKTQNLNDREKDRDRERERERIMTHTDDNKTGKSFQKISDLKQKLKQFQMINDKYKSGKKDKQKNRQKQIEKQKEKEKQKQKQKQKEKQISKSRKTEKQRDTFSRSEKSEKKSSELCKSRKQGQAIDQLKKFKHILENTESQIDISNNVNQDLNPAPDFTKFHHLSKLYDKTK